MSTPADLTGRIRQHLFFSLLPAETIPGLIQETTVFPCQADTLIFREGDASDSLYLVLEGSVRIVKNMPADPPFTLSRVEGNGFFVEYGVIDGSVRSASAVAAVDSTLARLPREPLLRALDAMHGTQVFGLLHHIIGSIRAANDRYVQEMVQRTRMSAVGGSLNTIIHDFRNPLTVIKLSANLMNRQIHEPVVANCCAMIDEQVTRMNDMAEDILDFARGVVRLERTPVSGGAITARFERLNRDYLDRTGIAFRSESADVWLMADQQKMLRVIQNLVNNAVEMLPKGNGRIDLRVAADGAAVVISVSDNGPGIPEALRTRLFEPFATAGKANGIGLGLAIVKSIVTSHEGVIQVETAMGKGTTFHLRFPRCQADGSAWTGSV